MKHLIRTLCAASILQTNAGGYLSYTACCLPLRGVAPAAMHKGSQIHYTRLQ